MPLKPLIDYAKTMINDTNAKVREAAINLFKVIYKHIGS
jgi:hypothetical protein